MCIEQVNSMLYTVLTFKRKSRLKFSACSVEVGKIHFASSLPRILDFIFKHNTSHSPITYTFPVF